MQLYPLRLPTCSIMQLKILNITYIDNNIVNNDICDLNKTG